MEARPKRGDERRGETERISRRMEDRDGHVAVQCEKLGCRSSAGAGNSRETPLSGSLLDQWFLV